MVSIASFELVPSEPNGEVEENVQSAEFKVFESSDDDVENITLSTELGVTTTEMCERVKKLLQENVDLKVKLQRNNQVMHEQLNIIATWRDQIAQTNSKHRTMLEDLVWQNQKLQDEKAELQKKIDELENASSTCEQCNVYKEDYSDLEKKLATTLSEKESLDAELKKSKQVLENSEAELLPSSFKFKESESSRKLDENGSLATIITDEESDYAIIIKEDFPLQESNHVVALKDIVTQYEQLQLQMCELSQKWSEEKQKSANLEKFLEEKVQKLETLQFVNLDLKSQNTENLSIISGFNDLKISSSDLKELEIKVAAITEERDEERVKFGNLEKNLGEKEQELKELQNFYSELKSLNTESLSIISAFDDDRKTLSSTSKDLETQVVEITKERDGEKLKCENIEKIVEEKKQRLKDLEIANSKLKHKNIEYSSVISMLKDDMKRLSCTIQALQPLRENCETLEDQVKTYKRKLDELQFVKCEKEHLIEKLRKEIKFSAENLSKEQVENELRRKNLIAVEQNFMQLYEEQQRMKKLTVKQEQDIQTQSQKMTSVEATERAKYQNEIDSLTAKLLFTEECLHAEEEKAGYLKREVKTLTEDSECIPILKAQVEIYKTELETERKAKENIALRELALSHEVSNLKEQIRNLQEMIVNQPHLQHRGSNHHYKTPRSASYSKHFRQLSTNQHTSSSGSTEERVQEFPCPCCSRTFTDINAVQSHVEQCLAESCP